MADRHRDPDPLSPRTLRLLLTLTGVLGGLAGVLFIIAFVLGIVREDAYRWALLVLGVLFLASPLAVRLVRAG